MYANVLNTEIFSAQNSSKREYANVIIKLMHIKDMVTFIILNDHLFASYGGDKPQYK